MAPAGAKASMTVASQGLCVREFHPVQGYGFSIGDGPIAARTSIMLPPYGIIHATKPSRRLHIVRAEQRALEMPDAAQ